MQSFVYSDFLICLSFSSISFLLFFCSFVLNINVFIIVPLLKRDEPFTAEGVRHATISVRNTPQRISNVFPTA